MIDNNTMKWRFLSRLSIERIFNLYSVIMNRLNYNATNGEFEIYEVHIYCLTAITEFAYLNVFAM